MATRSPDGAGEPSRNKALRDVSLLSAALYLARALLMVRGLLLARILGPSGFGIWTSIRLVRDFGRYAHLGAFQGMEQLTPHARGQGDSANAARYQRVAAAVAVVTALLSGVLTLAAAAWIGGEDRTTWALVAAVVTLNQLLLFYWRVARTEHRFTLTGGGRVGVALLSFVGLAAAWRYGLNGFVAALALAHVAVLALSARRRPFPVPLFDLATAGLLVRTGYRILCVNLLGRLLRNLDTLCLWALATRESFGLYALAAHVVDALMVIPVAAANVVYPRLRQTLGRSSDPAAARPYLERANLALACVACPILAALYLCLQIPVDAWLPRYAASAEVGRILALGSFFPIVMAIPQTVLVSFDAQRLLVTLRAAGVLLAGGLIISATAAGRPLPDVAWAASAGYAFSSSLLLVAAQRRAGLSATQIARRTLTLTAPFLVMCAVLLLWAPPRAGAAWTGDIASVATRLAAVCTPLALWTALVISRLRREHRPVDPDDASRAAR